MEERRPDHQGVKVAEVEGAAAVEHLILPVVRSEGALAQTADGVRGLEAEGCALHPAGRINREGGSAHAVEGLKIGQDRGLAREDPV